MGTNARLLVTVMALTPTLMAVTLPHRMVEKGNARFLATSTMVDGIYGAENEDAYLAELSVKGSGHAPILVQIIDEYPNWELPISSADLKSQAGITLRLIRDTECDTSFGALPLRAAAGDPIATLPQQMVFTPILPREINAGEILPCFRVVRHGNALPVEIQAARATRAYQ